MSAFYELNYYARTFYTGNGGNTDFLVTFYGGAPLEPGHIKVYVDQTEVFSSWSLVTINNATYVRFEIPPAGTSTGNVMLRRVTPATADTRVIDFSDGSVLTASDLDKSQLNSLYVSQESSDLFLDQGGAGVSINFAETITGSKTFTGTTTIGDEGSFKFLQNLGILANKSVNGKQYVLGANGVTGDVHWEETTINPGSLPVSVVQTDLPVEGQTITAPKTFNAPVILGDTLKVVGTSVVNKALVSNTNDGNVVWSPIVNSIKLGSDVAAPSTGTVVITPASIGALSAGASGGSQTVSGPVTFTGSVGLGDEVSADTLTITGQLKLNLSDGDEVIGKVLTCNAVDGTASWAPPAATGITSVNGLTGSTTGGVVEITPALLGVPVLVGSPQTIEAITTFSSTVNLGDDGNDRVNIPGKLYYTRSGYASGHVMTSQPDGEVIWAAVPPTGVISVNGDSSSAVTITAAGLGAVDLSSDQTIAGVKTFSGTAKAANAVVTNALTYNVGSNLQGKVLTSNASGVASWAPPAATGITSINDDYGPTVTITPASIGAAALGGAPQTITAVTSFTSNVNLGSVSTDTVTINGKMRYPVNGYAAGKVLFSQTDGEAIWASLPSSITEVNGKTGVGNQGAITLNAADVSAVGVSGDQNIGGVKTFTGTAKAAAAEITGTLKYNVGANLQGKVLTSDVSGNASWAAPAATGVTSVNEQSGPTVTLNAGHIGAVGLAGTQDITGAKTFTNNVTLGTDANDIIVIGGELQIPGATANGQVLMSSNGNKAIWQTPTAAGVTMVNGATGPISISADSLGAYTPAGAYPLPIATGNQKGIMQVGSGLAVDGAGVVSVTQNATLPIATADVLGGIKIGSGLSINPLTGVVSATLNGNVGVNKFNTRVGDVTPAAGDYTASQVTNAVDTNTAQDITASKKFTVLQTVSTASGAVGTSGSVGVSINPTGVIKAQSSAVNTHVIEAISPTGGVMAWVDSDGDATFSGKVTANGGFESSAGMTIGQNSSSIINITGSLQVLGGGSPGIGKVLTCQDNTVGAVAWEAPSNAPVSTVNTMTGAVALSLDGEVNTTGNLGGVTKSTAQTIAGTKTFSADQVFQANVTLGDAPADTILVPGTLKITSGNPAAGKYLQSDNLGNASWQSVASAPVTSVNGITGAVVIIADGTETDLIKSLNAVSKVGNQSIAGDKTFTGTTTFSGNVSIGATTASTLTVTSTPIFPSGAEPGRFMKCVDGTGATQWMDPVDPPVLSVNARTGTVVITADDTTAGTGIGAVTKSTAQTINSTKTFSVPQIFNADVDLGANVTNSITVKGTLKIPTGGSNGKFLKSDASGNASWGDGPAVPVQSVNGAVGAVVIIADGTETSTTKSLGAVTKDTTQTITGNKTFSGTTAFTGNVSLGDALSDTLTCTATPVFPHGATAGYVLTCVDTTGATSWQDAVDPPVISVNGRVNAVTITADEPTTGIGAVTKSTAQDITATKTFTVAQVFNAGVTLGDAGADVILVNGTLRIPTNPSAGRVLTSDSTGNASWANQTVTSVGTKIGTAATQTQTGAVVITAGLLGAATTADITSLTTQVNSATTAASNASAAAANAVNIASAKLGQVSTTYTSVNGAPMDLLSGNGTTDNPLYVTGAPPVGPATGGDLTGSYPSPTIGTNKVTYGKMQQVSQALRLLGNPSAVAGPANVTEISLGAGLGFVSGQLTNTDRPTVSASGANTFTGVNTFQGNVVVGDQATDTLTVNAAITTNGTVTLGTSNNTANAVTIVGPLKITSGTPGVGQVLTSNADGNASWEPLPIIPPGVPTFIGSMATWQPTATIPGSVGANDGNTEMDIAPSLPLGIEQLIPYSIPILSGTSSARLATLRINPGSQQIRVNGGYRVQVGTMSGNAASFTTGFGLKPLPFNTVTSVAVITMGATNGAAQWLPNTQTGYVSVTRIA